MEETGREIAWRHDDPSGARTADSHARLKGSGPEADYMMLSEFEDGSGEISVNVDGALGREIAFAGSMTPDGLQGALSYMTNGEHVLMQVDQGCVQRTIPVTELLYSDRSEADFGVNHELVERYEHLRRELVEEFPQIQERFSLLHATLAEQDSANPPRSGVEQLLNTPVIQCGWMGV